MLTFHTCDVFTDRPFAGNPLAIVLGADDLSTAQMLTLAREFNLSETIFVQRPADPSHTARVRIFFPTAEIPFAGHPTIGCAIHLATAAAGPGDFDSEIVLEEEAGLVRVRRAGPSACRSRCARPCRGAGSGPAGEGSGPCDGRHRLCGSSPRSLAGRAAFSVRAHCLACGAGSGASDSAGLVRTDAGRRGRQHLSVHAGARLRLPRPHVLAHRRDPRGSRDRVSQCDPGRTAFGFGRVERG